MSPHADALVVGGHVRAAFSRFTRPAIPPWRTLATTGAKFALAALMLALLIRVGALSPGAAINPDRPLAAFTLSMTCVLAALALGVYRWRLVLRAAGVQLAFARVLQMFWVGAFASTLLPGGISGDILRAIFVAREAPDACGRAAATVLVDRLVGLVGFVTTALILLAIRFDAWRNTPSLRTLAEHFALILTSAVLLGALAHQLWRAFQKTPLLQRALERLRKNGGRATGSLRSLGVMPIPSLVSVFLISLAIPLLLTLALVLFLAGSPWGVVSLADVGIASVAAQVANILPLTPGGVGVGEGVFEYVLTLLQPGTATSGCATAFLSLRIVLITANSAGGLFLLVPGNPFISAIRSPLPRDTGS